jgi:hypothetical protein
MKMYLTRSLGSTAIEVVECERVNDKSVWVVFQWAGRRAVQRRSRAATYEEYHDSWKAAHAFLLDRARREHAHAITLAQAALRRFEEVEAMKPPEEEA